MKWLLLAGAIAFEVTGTLSLRASEGLTRWGWVVLVAIGYVVSFVLFSRALTQGLTVGVGYAVWAALGVAAVAVLGRVLFDDPLPPVAVGGLVIIVVGVAVVQLGVGSR